MKAVMILAAAAGLLLPTAALAQAQAVDDERQVIEAVLRQRLSQVADGYYGLARRPRIALDARLLPDGARSVRDTQGEPHSGLLRSVAGALGLETARREDVYHCASRTPRSCRLDGVDMLVSFGMPDVDGDRATVAVAHLTFVPSDAERQPVHHGGQVLELEKVGGEWRIVRLVSMWTT